MTNEQQPTFRDSFKTRLNVEACSGSDRAMAFAAWAIPPADLDAWNLEKDTLENYGKDCTDKGVARVLGACLRHKHNSPFEHGLMSVYLEAPGVVWWQLTRQRFMSLDTEDFSFSLESGRYKHLDPEFYMPPDQRGMYEPEKFNPMRPLLESDPAGARHVREEFEAEFRSAWKRYCRLVGSNVAREVARLVLPNWALYCDGYVTAKPLTWLQFFSKRNSTPDTATATYPQWEIEQVARQCEDHFKQLWPLTYDAFIANGRAAP